MSYQPRTPFRRAYEAARLKDFAPKPCPDAVPPVDKWEVLRELGTARRALGLSDRTLTVLQALLSFHGETELCVNEEAPVIYPANARICERLNGMPCSTMRRHLAILIDMGLLIRRDSPNGKRFKLRYSGRAQAFGFDLSPLVTRIDEIRTLANNVRQEDAHLKQLRVNASLMRRDLAALSELARLERPDMDIWDAFNDISILSARSLRRKLTSDELAQLTTQLASSLADLQSTIAQVFPEEMSNTNAQIEHHNQSSNIEIENSRDQAKPQTIELIDEPNTSKSAVSLQFVKSVCLELKSYFSGPIQTWPDLFKAADQIRPMMGISPSVWQSAIRSMGHEQAAVVLTAMLERFTQIRSANGYLSYLSNKAEAGKFSCNPMLVALARQRNLESSQL